MEESKLEKGKYWLGRDNNESLFLYGVKPHKNQQDNEWKYCRPKEERKNFAWEVNAGCEFQNIQWTDEEPVPVYINTEGRARAIKDAAKNIKNLTQEEQEAVSELLDSLIKEI